MLAQFIEECGVGRCPPECDNVDDCVRQRLPCVSFIVSNQVANHVAVRKEACHNRPHRSSNRDNDVKVTPSLLNIGVPGDSVPECDLRGCRSQSPDGFRDGYHVSSRPPEVRHLGLRDRPAQSI